MKLITLIGVQIGTSTLVNLFTVSPEAEHTHNLGPKSLIPRYILNRNFTYVYQRNVLDKLEILY